MCPNSAIYGNLQLCLCLYPKPSWSPLSSICLVSWLLESSSRLTFHILSIVQYLHTVLRMHLLVNDGRQLYCIVYRFLSSLSAIDSVGVRVWVGCGTRDVIANVLQHCTVMCVTVLNCYLHTTCHAEVLSSILLIFHVWFKCFYVSTLWIFGFWIFSSCIVSRYGHFVFVVFHFVDSTLMCCD